MNKILSFSKTNEIAAAGTGIIELNEDTTIVEDSYFTVIINKISTKTTVLIEKINAAWSTTELLGKDEIRDLDVRAIFYEVEAKCIRRPSEKKRKALRIMEVLDRYSMKITADSYSNESTEIKAMLSDLNSPDLTEDLEAVPDLSGLILNLEASQAAFDHTQTKQIKTKVERDNSKPAHALAKEIKDIINNELCMYIEAMTLVDASKYKTFGELLSKLIQENNKKVHDRLATQKRKKGGAETE